MSECITKRMAQLIKNKRCTAGISQDALAEMIDVSRASVVGWEKGITKIRFNSVVKMVEQKFISAEEVDNLIKG